MMPMPSAPMGAQMDSPNASPAANPAALLGPSQSSPQAPSELGPSPEQQNQAFMAEIQDLTMRITGLARQFPAGAQDFEIAIQSLIEAMTKTIISSTSTEPTQAPNLVG